MYAQCPECLTFFHLKPSHLKAAQGRVRCSRCKHVFNALETLRDELDPEEIAAVEEARRREPKADAPLLSEEYAGDLFDSLEYTRNEELGFAANEADPDVPGGDEGEDALNPPPIAEPEIFAQPMAAPAREIHGFAGPRSRRRHPVLLAVGNALLLLALAAQIVHWQRFEILEHPLAGPYLARAYALLGIALEPPRDLAALRVSRTEVSSHPDHPRALHLTAVIENTADAAQPWPQLHVELQNRWGESVASRYFAPMEYLRNPRAAEMPLSANTRHAIELAIVDPGSSAVGFQIEPCFAKDNRRVCAADIDAAN